MFKNLTAMTYSEIIQIKDPKERLFAIMDRIEDIKTQPEIISNPMPFELENLEVKKMDAYSDWKDDF